MLLRRSGCRAFHCLCCARLSPCRATVAALPACLQDLLYTTVLASVMGFTRPARRLSKERPPERLMSLGIWAPVILQFVTCALFQVGGLVPGAGWSRGVNCRVLGVPRGTLFVAAPQTFSQLMPGAALSLLPPPPVCAPGGGAVHADAAGLVRAV